MITPATTRLFSRFLRRGGLLAALLCLLGTLGHSAAAQVAAGGQIPLGLNIDTNEQAYVDLIQPNGSFSALSGTLASDAQGWPAGDFQYFVDNRYTFEWFSGAPNIDPLQRSTDISGLYKLSFTGQATLGGWGMSIANQQYNAATNTTTADVTVPNPAGGVVFSLQFTGTRRQPGDTTPTGVTHVHFVRPGYTPGTSQVFTNLWLGSITSYPWNALRFMGALGTNNYAQPGSAEAYPYRLQWPTDRAMPGDGPLSASHVGVHGMPWEQVAAVAAATGRDIWINIPVNASDDYVAQLATLLHESLPANVHVYVEYSNEMWHLGFPQGPWNKQAAQDEVAAGGSNLNYDGISNPDIWRLRRIAKRTIEIGDTFKTVFGDNGTRIRPVINNAFVGFDPDILTYVTKNYGPPSQFLYGIAQTGYYSSADKSSVAAVLAGEKAASDANATGYVQSRTIASFYGLHSLTYEGGQGETGNQTPGPPYWGSTDPTLATLFGAARDPGMQGVEMHDLLGNWYPSGGDLYMQFSHVGRYSTYGFWGLSDDLTNQTSGKWLGVIQAMATPAPGVSAGAALPALIDGMVSVPETTPPNGNFSVPSDQPWLEKLLQVSAAGTYTLTLAGRQTDQSAPLGVWVDNTLIGAANLPSGAEGSSSLPLALTPGLHSLFVYGPPGSGPGGVSASAGDQLSLTLSSRTPTAPPTFSPAPGTYSIPQHVTFADAAPGAAIYYTLDGSAPTTASTLYTGPITVSGTSTVTAIAVAAGYGPSSPASAAYTIAAAPTSLPAGADAYVRAGAFAGTNFGTQPVLICKKLTGTSPSAYNRCVYLKFDLTNVTSAPVSARLTITVNAASNPANLSETVQIYAVADTSWTESELTWNNAPGLDRTRFLSTGTLLASQPVPLKPGPAAFDLTAFVQANRGKIVTLQLLDASAQNLYLVFNSKEAAVSPPVLTLAY